MANLRNVSMDKMKRLVQDVLEADAVPTAQLQRINEAMLKEYKLSYGGLTVLPKEVEVFYVNCKAKVPFVDSNMHCMLDKKTNDEIWSLQAGRFGRLYMHRKGLGGVDVCLSDSDDYALCCTLKAAVVNGEEYWSPLRVRNAILDAVCRSEGLEIEPENRLRLMLRFNEREGVTLLSPREKPLEGYVYHLHRRSLRRRDKHVKLPLRSFIDLWNKKLQMGNVQKINLYMAAHSDADVLDVLRANGFRYIPGEIKARYRIDRKAKLFPEV